MTWKRTKRWWVWAILVVGLMYGAMPSCMSFRMSPNEVKKYFANLPQKPRLHYLLVDNHQIHYAEIGSDTLPMVVFVHGSPGAWSDWIGFFKDSILLPRVHLLAVDRAGFGYSDFGDTETSLATQARLIAEVVKLYPHKRPIILVGHSLGGPVIARFAMDYPQLVDRLVFVAPSIDPALEGGEWYRGVGDFFLVRWMLPTALRVSNQEILPLRGELEQMLPHWTNIQQPTIFIHGTADNLVPVANVDFAKKMLLNAPVKYVIVEKMNHFVPWQHPELIREAILESLPKK